MHKDFEKGYELMVQNAIKENSPFIILQKTIHIKCYNGALTVGNIRHLDIKNATLESLIAYTPKSELQIQAYLPIQYITPIDKKKWKYLIITEYFYFIIESFTGIGIKKVDALEIFSEKLNNSLVLTNVLVGDIPINRLTVTDVIKISYEKSELLDYLI